MNAASCSLPSSPNFLDKQELNKLLQLYSLDIRDCEIEVFRSFVARHDTSKFETLIDVLDIVDKDIFPSIYSLYQLLVTIPQTSCKVERMFSSVKRIKTHLCSKMTTVRLNSLALLSTGRDIIESLKKSGIINFFKTCLRSKMITVLLNSLALLSTERDIMESLKKSDIINFFKSMRHCRLL